MVIAQEDKIRLKIVGTRVDATGIVSIIIVLFRCGSDLNKFPLLVCDRNADGRLSGISVQLKKIIFVLLLEYIL